MNKNYKILSFWRIFCFFAYIALGRVWIAPKGCGVALSHFPRQAKFHARYKKTCFSNMYSFWHQGSPSDDKLHLPLPSPIRHRTQDGPGQTHFLLQMLINIYYPSALILMRGISFLRLLTSKYLTFSLRSL